MIAADSVLQAVPVDGDAVRDGGVDEADERGWDADVARAAAEDVGGEAGPKLAGGPPVVERCFCDNVPSNVCKQATSDD